jgi:hypothetical protein
MQARGSVTSVTRSNVGVGNAEPLQPAAFCQREALRLAEPRSVSASVLGFAAFEEDDFFRWRLCRSELQSMNPARAGAATFPGSSSSTRKPPVLLRKFSENLLRHFFEPL